MDEFSTLLQEIRFSERFRGYDPDEVDAYVHTVAKAAAQMQGRLRELQERVEAAEARTGSGGAGGETEETLTRTLLLAQRTADAAVAEAEAEAARMLAEAEERSGTVVTEAEERATVLVSAAQSQAAALMADADAAASGRLRDAQDRSARMLAEAETDRRRILADAEAEAASLAIAQRDRALAEVSELEARRTALHSDIDALDRQVADQRSQLQRALIALRSLIEDPANFGLPDQPTAETAPIEVAAPGAHDLQPEPEVTGAVTAVVEPEVQPDVVDLTGAAPAPPAATEPEVDEPEVSDLAAISEEFAVEIPAVVQDESPVESLPLIDDFEHPDIAVEELVGDVESEVRGSADDREELPVELPRVDEQGEPEALIPPVPSFETTSEPRDEVEELIDITETALAGHPPATGSDEVVIDLVAESEAPPIDLSLEPPVDAEVVSDTEPAPAPPVHEISPEADVRTAPPRFVTAADLDQAEVVDADEVEPGPPQAFDAGPTVSEPETPAVEVIEQLQDTAEPGPGIGRSSQPLVDFEEIESQPITQPVPVVEPEHPSLFTSEPGPDEAFLAQLREAVSADDQPLSDEADEDALSAFFEEEDEERTRGWFGRKR